jgi:hypothetical protein
MMSTMKMKFRQMCAINVDAFEWKREKQTTQKKSKIIIFSNALVHENVEESAFHCDNIPLTKNIC